MMFTLSFCPPFRLRHVSRLVLMVLAILFLIKYVFWRHTGTPRPDKRFSHPLSFKLEQFIPSYSIDQTPPTCPGDLDHLRRPEYGLTREILYQQRCIRPIINDTVDRNQVEETSKPLLGKDDLLQLHDGCRGRRRERCDSIELRVPPAYPKKDYSHIFFGVATSYDRLNASMSQFEGWLAGSNARLLVMLTDTDVHERDFNKITLQYREHGMDILVIRPWNEDIGANEQHFIIIRDLVWLSAPETKWIAIIDDDTYFPTLYPLGQALEKHDPNTPVYLGALSENFDQVKAHGFMAFGGAGAFLSMPLARTLEVHIEECLKEDTLDQGDGLLKNCIYRRTKTKLSIMPGLHQLDMWGDMSGFYESGVLPTSLHHFKSWHDAPVDKMGKITEFCGGCFLQRFKFGPDTILTNGYSITVYPNGTDGIDLSSTEATWDSALGFEWSLGPMRQKVDESHKKSYRLIDAEKLGNSFRQIYVHRAKRDTIDSEEKGNSNENKPEALAEPRDEVVELWWDW